MSPSNGVTPPLPTSQRRSAAGLDQETVVADQDDGAFVIVDRLHQGGARVDVEVVRRLVEDEHVRALDGGQPHQQPRLLAARKLRHRRLGLLAREPHPGDAAPDLGVGTPGILAATWV
jgi:hypothetical protein